LNLKINVTKLEKNENRDTKSAFKPSQ